MYWRGLCLDYRDSACDLSSKFSSPPSCAAFFPHFFLSLYSVSFLFTLVFYHDVSSLGLVLLLRGGREKKTVCVQQAPQHEFSFSFSHSNSRATTTVCAEHNKRQTKYEQTENCKDNLHIRKRKNNS